MKIVPIQKARLLDGATRFSESNVSVTYRGQVLLSDGSIRSAIIKDLDRRELGIELLVAALGKLLGLPVPNAYLVVSDKTLASAVGPLLNSGQRLLFASEDARSPPVMQLYRSTATIKEKVLRRLATIDAVYALFSFDTWTANIDRHAGNLLLSSKGVWFIDHGRCFGGPSVDFSALDADTQYPQVITHEIARIMTSEQKQKVSERCGQFPIASSLLDAAQILSKSDIEAILGPVDFNVTAEFLRKRRSRVPKLGSKIVGLELIL